MQYSDAAIPVGLAWSSPFARWQGALAEVSSIDLAEAVTTAALKDRGLDPRELAGLVLGWTVPQPEIFYGAPTLAARIGAPATSGPMISEACATSVACLHAAASSVVAGSGPQLVVATDRTSNGPHLVYPSGTQPGGAPRTEHWVLDSFKQDPWAGTSMLAAAELVAEEAGVTRADLDELAALRWRQYESALADDRSFQRRYMVPVRIPRRRGTELVVDGDEGVRPVERESAARLAPAAPDGMHTFATQTHPADGCAGAVVAPVAVARELSAGRGIARVLATGFARVAKSHMPQAPVPAAREALTAAGLDAASLDAVTTHNPFAVNDLYLARSTGIAIDRMNAHGSSLIFGHPQAPTGLRSIAELVTELHERGGGRGLFTGCAAGDVGAALVVEVTE